MKKYTPFAVLLLVFGLSTCSEWQGASAKFVISFEGAGRAVYEANDGKTHDKLEHQIVFSRNKETVNFRSKGADTFESYIEPGNWTVWVYSWLNDEGEPDIYAAGTIDDYNFQAGQNNVLRIQMYNAHLVKFNSGNGSAVPDQVVFHGERAVQPSYPTHASLGFEGWYTEENQPSKYGFTEKVEKSITLYAKWEELITVGDDKGDIFRAKLNWLNNDKNLVERKHYLVIAKENENIYLQNLDLIEKNVTITITGGTVSFNPIGFLKIPSGVKLILENITLQGTSSRPRLRPIIVVEGGELVINNGTVIKGSANVDPLNEDGHDVGGIFVNGGTFTMNGGEISGNSAEKNGGGVYLASGTSFTKNGGTIYGYTSGDNKSNKVTPKQGTVQTYLGSAVYAGTSIREKTAGPSVFLSVSNNFASPVNQWE